MTNNCKDFNDNLVKMIYDRNLDHPLSLQQILQCEDGLWSRLDGRPCLTRVYVPSEQSRAFSPGSVTSEGRESQDMRTYTQPGA